MHKSNDHRTIEGNDHLSLVKHALSLLQCIIYILDTKFRQFYLESMNFADNILANAYAILHTFYILG